MLVSRNASASIRDHHTQRSTVKVFFSRQGEGKREGGESGGTESDLRGVFQAHPSHSFDNMSMMDVRDAVETCAYTRGDERRECFLNFGLSSDRVDKYYEPVSHMEELAKGSVDDDDVIAQRMVKIGGFMLLMGAVVLRRGA